MIKSLFLRAAAAAVLLSACVPMVSTLSLYMAKGPGAETGYACSQFESYFQFSTGPGALENSKITFERVGKSGNTYEVVVVARSDTAANPILSLAGIRVQTAGRTYQPTLVRQDPPREFNFFGAARTKLSGVAQFRLGSAQPDSVVVLPPPALLVFGGKRYVVPPMKFDWTVETRPHIQSVNC